MWHVARSTRHAAALSGRNAASEATPTGQRLQSVGRVTPHLGLGGADAKRTSDRPLPIAPARFGGSWSVRTVVACSVIGFLFKSRRLESRKLGYCVKDSLLFSAKSRTSAR